MIEMRSPIVMERQQLFDVGSVLTMQIVIRPKATFEQLRQAFESACHCHEIFSSRIELDASGKAYYTDCDHPQNSFSQTELSLQELIRENERIRFRLEKGEFLRGFDAPSGVVFMLHHLGEDGKSLLYLIETFLNCLSGKEPAFLPFHCLREEDLPRRSGLSLPYRITMKMLNRMWRRDKQVFTLDDLDRSFATFWKNRQTSLSVSRYDWKALDQLLKQSKEAKVSLTSWLLTDMVRAQPDQKASFGLSATHRVSGNRAMGNYSTGIIARFRYRPRKSFEQNAKRMQRLIHRRLQNVKALYMPLHVVAMLDTTLPDAMNFEHTGIFHSRASGLAAYMAGYGKKVRTMSVSNLLRSDIPLTYGPYHLENLIFIPPVVSYEKT